jgi:hypothetical protein
MVSRISISYPQKAERNQDESNYSCCLGIEELGVAEERRITTQVLFFAVKQREVVLKLPAIQELLPTADFGHGTTGRMVHKSGESRRWLEIISTNLQALSSISYIRSCSLFCCEIQVFSC